MQRALGVGGGARNECAVRTVRIEMNGRLNLGGTPLFSELWIGSRLMRLPVNNFPNFDIRGEISSKRNGFVRFFTLLFIWILEQRWFFLRLGEGEGSNRSRLLQYNTRRSSLYVKIVYYCVTRVKSQLFILSVLMYERSECVIYEAILLILDTMCHAHYI